MIWPAWRSVPMYFRFRYRGAKQLPYCRADLRRTHPVQAEAALWSGRLVAVRDLRARRLHAGLAPTIGAFSSTPTTSPRSCLRRSAAAPRGRANHLYDGDRGRSFATVRTTQKRTRPATCMLCLVRDYDFYALVGRGRQRARRTSTGWTPVTTASRRVRAPACDPPGGAAGRRRRRGAVLFGATVNVVNPSSSRTTGSPGGCWPTSRACRFRRAAW